MMRWGLFFCLFGASTAAAAGDTLDVHDPAQPVALGSRMGMWTGPYSAPALGGHIKLKPSNWLGLEGFADHTLVIEGNLARHDHVLGFSSYAPALLGSEAWFVAPTLGACVDFRVDTPLVDRSPSNTDVLFGAHAGLMLEAAVAPRISLEANAQGFAYVGNQIRTQEWTAGASSQLHLSAVVQLLASVNVTL